MRAPAENKSTSQQTTRHDWTVTDIRFSRCLTFWVQSEAELNERGAPTIMMMKLVQCSTLLMLLCSSVLLACLEAVEIGT
jgi:hypothetical protein